MQAGVACGRPLLVILHGRRPVSQGQSSGQCGRIFESKLSLRESLSDEMSKAEDSRRRRTACRDDDVSYAPQCLPARIIPHPLAHARKAEILSTSCAFPIASRPPVSKQAIRCTIYAASTAGPGCGIVVPSTAGALPPFLCASIASIRRNSSSAGTLRLDPFAPE